MATEQLHGEGALATAAIEKAVRESLPAGSKEDVVEGLVKEVVAALAGPAAVQEQLAEAEFVKPPAQGHLSVRIACGRMSGPAVKGLDGRIYTFEGKAPELGPTEGSVRLFCQGPNLVRDTNFYTVKTFLRPFDIPHALTLITYFFNTELNNHLNGTLIRTGWWLGAFIPPLRSGETLSGTGRFT